MPAIVIPKELPEVGEDHRAARAGVLGRFRDPLYRTGYALTINTVGISVLGFVFWAAAAHLYSRQAVGRSSALLSALILISSLTLVNFNIILQRFLPQAGTAAGRLIRLGYAVSSLASLPVALAFVFVMPRLLGQWRFLADSPLLATSFVVAAVIWAVFSLEDDALIGLRRAAIVPVENGGYGVLKLVMLICIAGMLPSAGIFVSYVVPLLVVIPVINWLIFRRYAKLGTGAAGETGFRLRDISRFASIDYLAALLNQAYGSLLPLVVLSVLGAAANAGFYVAWTIAIMPTMVAVNFGTSLIVEAMTEPSHLAALTRGTLVRAVAITLLGTIALLIGGRLILSIYGASYAAHDHALLAVLALAPLPRTLVALSWSLDQVAGRVGRAAITQAVLAALVLGGSRFMLKDYGILGVGYAWTGANLAIAIARLPTIVSAARSRPQSMPAPASRATGPRVIASLRSVAGRHRAATRQKTSG